MEKSRNGVLLGAALIISSVVIALGLSNIITPERSVSVRGLSEKEVDADLAVWTLSFSVGGNNLPALQKDIVSKTETVKSYLKDHSLDESDFTVQPAAITDNSLNAYMDMDKVRYTYIGRQSVLVRSTKVAAVKSAYADSFSLASSGIAVSRDYGGTVSYDFTKLNDIKPEMIAEATKNARLAAEQFARDSNSKVGKIKQATQGLFTIEDAAPGLEEKKNVRVVTTVQYLLK